VPDIFSREATPYEKPATLTMIAGEVLVPEPPDPVGTGPSVDPELVPLLSDQISNNYQNTQDLQTDTIYEENSVRERRVIPEDYISRVLPIALTAACAIAATSATTTFAYASLMCKDPAHCKEKERNKYAEVVAVATTITNVFGVVAVGALQHLIRRNTKIGLSLWLILRATSIGVLAIGGEQYAFYFV